jgi:hypothetical protein
MQFKSERTIGSVLQVLLTCSRWTADPRVSVLERVLVCVDAGGLTWSKMSIFRLRLQLGTKKAKKVKCMLKKAMVRSCCDGWR